VRPEWIRETTGTIGTWLLRAALVGGLYVILLVAGTLHPIPDISEVVFEFVNFLSALALSVGLIAPLFALLGAVLVYVARRRLNRLEWASVGVAFVSLLFPVLFTIAFSNCPRHIC